MTGRDWTEDWPMPTIERAASPRPWKWKRATVGYGPSRGETEYVIHDANGRYVGGIDRAEDAEIICASVAKADK